VDDVAEWEVCVVVVRRLIFFEEFADVLLWLLIEVDLVDELWVDVVMVWDWFVFLDEYEMEYLDKTIRVCEVWV